MQESAGLSGNLQGWWPVTVIGRAALVTDLGIIALYLGPPLVPWTSGVCDQFVTITTDLVEGLRVGNRADGIHCAGRRRLPCPNPLRGR